VIKQRNKRIIVLILVAVLGSMLYCVPATEAREAVVECHVTIRHHHTHYSHCHALPHRATKNPTPKVATPTPASAPTTSPASTTPASEEAAAQKETERTVARLEAEGLIPATQAEWREEMVREGYTPEEVELLEELLGE